VNPGCDPTHLDLLGQGADAWNSWRLAHPGLSPKLAGADLSDRDLTAFNLSEADLSDAELCQSDLSGTNLKMVQFAGADLSGARLDGAALYKATLSGASLTAASLKAADLTEADLSRADLRAASLRSANLTDSNLRGATLSEADLTEANLSRADIAGANLCFSNLVETIVTGVHYGAIRSMRGHYHGIRGLASCFGNALFVRDAQDQDYLDTLKHHIEHTPDAWNRRWKRGWFAAWSFVDYGRSLVKPAVYALVLVLGFGFVYLLDMSLGWGLMDYSDSSKSLFTPFYYSIVTYTTLGFGDITPRHWIGEIIVVGEVILGYTTLGLLLAILANKVARRS